MAEVVPVKLLARSPSHARTEVEASSRGSMHVELRGSVDDTSPQSAAEGEERSVRATPEGNLRAELTKDNVAIDGNAYNADAVTAPTTATLLSVLGFLAGLAPDGAVDRLRTLGDTAGAGLGVLAAAHGSSCHFVLRNPLSGGVGVQQNSIESASLRNSSGNT